MAFIVIREVISRGKPRFKAIVRMKRGALPELSKSKTYDNRKQAIAWAENERLILSGEKLDLVSRHDQNILYSNSYLAITSESTIAEIISEFIAWNAMAPKGYSSTYIGALQHLNGYDLTLLSPSNVDWLVLKDFCVQRSVAASPQTLWVDLHALCAAIKSIEEKFNMDLSSGNLIRLKSLLIKDGYIKKSNKRSRRPTEGEVRAILNTFREFDRTSKSYVSYLSLFKLYIYTCLRESELLNICWGDINYVRKCIKIRKNKNTLRNLVIEERDIPLTQEMIDVLGEMSRENKNDDDYIFNIKSCSKRFKEELNKQGIFDIRVHDLRREGISRYLENGMTIEQVIVYTGHRDLNLVLDVYAMLNPKKVAQYWNEKNIKPLH